MKPDVINWYDLASPSSIKLIILAMPSMGEHSVRARNEVLTSRRRCRG